MACLRKLLMMTTKRGSNLRALPNPSTVVANPAARRGLSFAGRNPASIFFAPIRARCVRGPPLGCSIARRMTRRVARRVPTLTPRARDRPQNTSNNASTGFHFFHVNSHSTRKSHCSETSPHFRRQPGGMRGGIAVISQEAKPHDEHGRNRRARKKRAELILTAWGARETRLVPQARGALARRIPPAAPAAFRRGPLPNKCFNLRSFMFPGLHLHQRFVPRLRAERLGTRTAALDAPANTQLSFTLRPSISSSVITCRSSPAKVRAGRRPALMHGGLRLPAALRRPEFGATSPARLRPSPRARFPSGCAFCLRRWSSATRRAIFESHDETARDHRTDPETARP